ncbi:MAG: helix-turn-helix domain-containing protein [Dehalococcoidia bacterium]|nr:helix-turn-helix domain-containing protein [Dehalococcoidia bacterium]MCA9824076.1 helix-turn-helix domain-containing protein [Dehalococcoidia bacterium]MCA9843035.1 helix-turn-helix domain-containing protein [Dehalococcoidia bacterium]MCA9853478.1 helix-turn-helix domain-containing protein [Dehalococcoidia bacterium]
MATSQQLTADLCSVCGEGFQPHTLALCSQCGKAYHLNQRQDLEGKDCGDVWISDEHMALEFACNSCLLAEDGALDDVLDLGEAANLAQVSEAELVKAVEAGAIKHRRTTGGVLLFRRADVIAFLAGAR